MTSLMTATVSDYSEEKSRISFHVPAITAANHDDVVLAVGTLAIAVGAITDGLVNSYTVQHSKIRLSNEPGSSDTESRRERKMFVIYEDDITLEPFSLEVPSPDMSQLTYDGKTDEITLADGGAMASFVGSLEANAVSPNGNPITVVRAYVTGRLL